MKIERILQSDITIDHFRKLDIIVIVVNIYSSIKILMVHEI